MMRWGFLFGIAGAAIAALASCEDTEGLSGGSNVPDAAADRTADDGSAPPADGAVEAAATDAGCDAPAADPAFLSDAVDIDSSGYFVCAVRENGQVVCWGDNTIGQLGVAAPDAGGTVASSDRPVAVPGIPP